MGSLFPQYSKCERIADAFIHVTGMSLSIAVAAGLMVVAIFHLPALHVVALGIYCFGMVSMFVSSACYNMLHSHRWREYLRRVDHSAIFVMIAGSYTPFTLLKIGGIIGYGLLAAVWGIAIAGVILKLRFPHRFERLAIALYLAQGWAIVVALNPLLASVSARALTLLILGGCLYSVGVIFHSWKKLKFHNAIWHGFVLVAAACHFGAVCDAVFLT
jgi:hemolysin III